MHILFGLLSGLVFGIGLVISGMSNPAKVLNFLDVAGTWDPSLAFVMGGASVTTFIGYRLILNRPAPALADVFQMPTAAQIDRPLLVGSALFGIGWGYWRALPRPGLDSAANDGAGGFDFPADDAFGSVAWQPSETAIQR